MVGPNVFVIMTDQERYPPGYEGPALEAWRRDHLPGRERLRTSSVELHRHLVASTACLPSRTSLFTGQYPSLHGVANTDGLAKSAHDPSMVWLDPGMVPTMGDWFRAGGYDTHYRGKWHLSHPDLMSPGQPRGLRTNDDDGVVFASAVDAYRRADRLDPFGFSGWIGREPHGGARSDTGLVRDGLFAEQVVELFRGLATRESRRPWMAVASFVNPHDIAFTGVGRQFLRFPDIDDSVPEVPEAPTQQDSFAGRPSCHERYRDTWTAMLYPQPCDEEYRRFYMWLHLLVDRAVERIVDELHATGMADDTIVVFTSDHGELLGAHGGLQQKWHNAYDETIRVPMWISGPGIEPRDGGVTIPTSHVDVLPTLLGLAGVDVEAAAAGLRQTHVETQPLCGRDLSAVVRGEAPAESAPVYFVTEDEISRGMRMTGVVSNLPFDAVAPPAHVEAVVDAVAGETWKLVRYFDRADPSSEVEWELHNLTRDPFECTNLPAAGPVFDSLSSTLVATRERVMRTPSLSEV